MESPDFKGTSQEGVGLCQVTHPVGTCRMGLDANSVTDPEGRLRGVEVLRVVDALLMPTIIASNTYTPAMMIAETIARRVPGRPTVI